MPEVEITPLCTRGENIFISSEGWVMPCCYSHRQMRQVLSRPDSFAEKDRWFERNRHWFDMRTRAVKDILADERWFELAANWASGNAPDVCVRVCGVGKESGVSHIRQVIAKDRSRTQFT